MPFLTAEIITYNIKINTTLEYFDFINKLADKKIKTFVNLENCYQMPSYTKKTKKSKIKKRNSKVYYDYNITICPICGNRIKHPYTGIVTTKQIQEDIDNCLWMEVIDEGGSTIGYVPLCKGKSNAN